MTSQSYSFNLSLTSQFLLFDMQKIKINLYIPEVALKTISVPLPCRIDSLKKFLPPNYDIYIHQGCEINSSLTFADSGIKCFDTLIALPSKTFQSGTNWSKMSTETSFADKIQCTANPNNKMEIARLRDLKFFQIERKSKRFTKLVGKFNDSIEARENEIRINRYNTVIPDRLDDIPIEPLPVMWDTEETRSNACKPLPIPEISSDLYPRSIPVESQA